jgi:hypothetical protein
MIFHPAIIALLAGSLLISLMLCYSCIYGARILKSWDMRSGSELQLSLERRTYLISTIMTYMLGFQLLSLLLFIYTADNLSGLFVGAMCAAGSLNANYWGYPTILLKIANFLLAGLWLVLNYIDNRGYDYPLIKKKYGFLLVLTPFILLEMVLQGAYFFGLEPEIITSCCGTLFTSDSEGVTSGIVALPVLPVEIGFYSSMALTVLVGAVFYMKGNGGYLFSLLSFITFLASVVALLSFVSLYFYELPTHHCPFCIMHQEYGYVGYGLYLTFLGGAVSGLGVGVTMPFRGIVSLRDVLPRIQRELCLASLISYTVFLAIVLYGVIFSNLTLRGY